MDHDDNRIDQDYVLGFNEGYVMMQHMPRLARSVARAMSTSARMKGFRHGCQSYVTEKILNRARRLREFLQQDEEMKKAMDEEGEGYEQ